MWSSDTMPKHLPPPFQNDHQAVPDRTGYLVSTVTTLKVKEQAVLCQEGKGIKKKEAVIHECTIFFLNLPLVLTGGTGGGSV